MVFFFSGSVLAPTESFFRCFFLGLATLQKTQVPRHGTGEQSQPLISPDDTLPAADTRTVLKDFELANTGGES